MGAELKVISEWFQDMGNANFLEGAGHGSIRCHPMAASWSKSVDICTSYMCCQLSLAVLLLQQPWQRCFYLEVLPTYTPLHAVLAIQRQVSSAALRLQQIAERGRAFATVLYLWHWCQSCA